MAFNSDWNVLLYILSCIIEHPLWFQQLYGFYAHYYHVLSNFETIVYYHILSMFMVSIRGTPFSWGMCNFQPFPH